MRRVAVRPFGDELPSDCAVLGKPGLMLSNRLLVQSLSTSRCIECHKAASTRADDQGGERRALHATCHSCIASRHVSLLHRFRPRVTPASHHATCHSCIASRHVSLLHRIELLRLVAAIESERADPTVLRRVEQPAIYKERAF